MKSAFITQYDSADILSWSGSTYYISRALEMEGIELSIIDSLEPSTFEKIPFEIKKRFYKGLFGKSYLRNRELSVAKRYAGQIHNHLESTQCNFIFSPETIPLAYLDHKLPIIFWTDATFAGMIDFYPKFQDLCDETLRNGHEIERLAIERSTLAIYSSDWAAKTAIKNYNAPETKVKVVPFGANIQCDRTYEDIKTILDSKERNVCRLLFLGVDWVRKGGDLALEVARQLNLQGFPTELWVIGCEPKIDQPLPSFVKNFGFVSKNSEQGQKTLSKAFTEAHFLIVPSLAECYGLVFCEANSFGVPCLSTQVGGIPTVVKDDLNGKLFPLSASAQEYCSFILSTLSDYSQYMELAFSSFNEYQSRLNWSVAGKAVKQLIQESIA